MVQALFLCRNRMLHSGFEWPEADRTKFTNAIAQQKLPDGWFEHTEKGEEPWIFYMSEGLIARVLELVDLVLGAAGRHLRLIEATAPDPVSPADPRPAA